MSDLRPVRGNADEVLALLRAWDAADSPERLVVETTGSTGVPKRVLLSRDALRASADATHARLGGAGQWLLTVPPTYVAGLQVLVRSIRAGIDPLHHEGSMAGSVDAMAGPRRYVSLVPTQLVRLLAEPGEPTALARFDAVLVGGGPLLPRVRREAEKRGIRVVQTYGMSETCGGCVYDGVPLDGVGVKVDDDQEVWVTGPVLFDGYLGDPERTARTLVDGWFRTDDLGALDEDGRLSILGRRDDVVISGGVKVPAVAVQQMLLEHPAVQDAAVVGVPDEEWGERVVAVVACDGAPARLDELRRRVTPRSWAPKAVVVVRSLPSLRNGKLDRAAVRQLAGDA
jgi:O-succinylbenzoic acid--CoA ligase